MRRMHGLSGRGVAAVGALCLAAGAAAFTSSASAAARSSRHVASNAIGALDCNGFSPIQRSVKISGACTDPKGYDGGRFYDNGHYIGHDEPIIRFLSSRPGSGNDITWTEQLPRDPAQAPTVATPGSDVTHWFELSLAPWFSMALCNPESYPYRSEETRLNSSHPSISYAVF